MFPPEEQGRDQLQRDTLMHSTDLDVRGQHNPCSCPRIGQIGTEPDMYIYNI